MVKSLERSLHEDLEDAMCCAEGACLKALVPSFVEVLAQRFCKVF